MNITYLVGDAVHPHLGERPGIIAHVVNNSGGWGSGFVVPLGRAYPIAEHYYRSWAAGKRLRGFDGHTPGTFDLGFTQFVFIRPTLAVANMCAQNGYKSAENPVPLDYDALFNCLIATFSCAKTHGAHVHMPRIGCGRGGGNWDEVLHHMETALKLTPYADFDPIEVFVYDLP